MLAGSKFPVIGGSVPFLLPSLMSLYDLTQQECTLRDEWKRKLVSGQFITSKNLKVHSLKELEVNVSSQ